MELAMNIDEVTIKVNEISSENLSDYFRRESYSETARPFFVAIYRTP